MSVCVCGLYVGGLQATAELLTLCDSEVSASDSAFVATLRRYACMTLTNLTYADTVNKTTLCQMSAVLKTLVALLRSPDEDLRQVCTVPRCVCMLLSVCLSVCLSHVCLCVCQGASHSWKSWKSVLFCSLAIVDPRVGHTVDILSPFISVLCHCD